MLVMLKRKQTKYPKHETAQDLNKLVNTYLLNELSSLDSTNISKYNKKQNNSVSNFNSKLICISQLRNIRNIKAA